jgi:hypothetical protein
MAMRRFKLTTDGPQEAEDGDYVLHKDYLSEAEECAFWRRECRLADAALLQAEERIKELEGLTVKACANTYYLPKTELGKRLYALRNKALEKGMKTLSKEAILEDE